MARLNRPVHKDNSVDSALYVSGGSSSFLTSISSSIRKYKYHAFRDGEYVMPNDEEEQDRMDLLHHVFLLILGGELFVSPIERNGLQRVLDLGTGTGIWAIDFAECVPLPLTREKSIPISGSRGTPPNCVFEIDDYEAEWSYSRPFDFIHGRELVGCINDYDRFFRQAFKNLRSGGYFEMQSFKVELYSDDGSLDKAKMTRKWVDLLQDSSNKFGKSMLDMDNWKDRMVKVGFTQVNCRIDKIPLGPWAKDRKKKEIGAYMQAEQLQAIPSYTYRLFSHILGWSKTEIEVLMAGLRSELLDQSIHQYGKMYFVYGRKP
ncbi:S-adenosyl-L-methionine-dependent methyltransferase [Elaphomyces granulatus]